MKLLESIWQDVSYALRAMRRTPMMTAAAVLSLGLGIGANTAIFSLIDTILLRSLPVRSPQELVQLTWDQKRYPRRFVETTSGRGLQMAGKNVRLSFSFDTYRQLRERSTAFAGVVGRFRVFDSAIVIAQGRADTAKADLVSGNFFDVLGIQPAAGRLLADSDEREGAAPAAVLSHAYWTSRFAADSGVVGRTILINGVTYNVAGVAAEGFLGLEVGSSVDLFLPLTTQPLVAKRQNGNSDMLHTPGWWWVEIVGRKKPGLTDAQMRAEVDTLLRQSLTTIGSKPVKPEDYPALVFGQAGQGQSGMRNQFSRPLVVLMTIVGFVLLIGCANVANLLMARAVARRKEMAMRHALGATSSRLFRQMIVESIVLSLLGGAAGLAIAHWGTTGMLRIFSDETNPLTLDVQTNAQVLAFLVGVSVLVGLLFGLAPAVRSARVDLNTMLKGSSGDSVRRFGMGRVLVTLQVAVSLALLVGAGLYVRTLWNLRHVTLGFNPDNVLVFRIAPKRGGYQGDRMQQLIDRLSAKVRETPGVRSVSYSQLGLLTGWTTNGPVQIPGKPTDNKNGVYMLDVGPDFFSSMQIRMAAGRALDVRDVKGAPMAAVVNEHFAKTYFGSGAPLGAQFSSFLDNYKRPMEIVGVIQDAKYDTVSRETVDVVYLPYAQHVDEASEAVFVARTSGDPRALANVVRSEMQSIDPNLPLFGVTTQKAQFDANIRDERLMAGLAGGFGALALVLAAIGMYGVIAYSVTRRTAEIGIRMALGAGGRRVLVQVLRESLLPVGVGIIAGLGIAWGATTYIASQLYGLKPRDLSTMVAAAGLIVAVAIVATLLPARRASRVDPMTALRHD
jgi:macrolide transport system ATP-binding/permease protein